MALGLSALGGAGWQFTDNNSSPLAGGKIYIYLAGTTTPTPTYTSADGSELNTQPIVLDAAGRVEEEIWLESDTLYKFTLTDAFDVEIWTKDNIPGIFVLSGLDEFIALLASPSGSTLVGYSAPAGIPRTVQDKLREFISVKDYGAIGDGVSNDTVFFQAAINQAKHIFIPPGIYLVSTLEVLSGTFLYGGGASSIVKQLPVLQGTSLFNLTNANDVKLTNFVINGSGNEQPTGEDIHGIKIVDSLDLHFEDLEMHDCNGDLINISSTTDEVLSRNITITDLTGFNLGRHGIYSFGFGVRDIFFDKNRIIEGTRVTTSSSIGKEIYLSQTITTPVIAAGGGTISSNILTGTGMALDGTFTALSIVNNTIFGGENADAKGLIGIKNSNHVVVSNNTITSDGITLSNAIQIEDTGVSTSSDAQDLIITGNTINTNASGGIVLSGSGTGVPSYGKIIISNNTISNIGNLDIRNPIAILTKYNCLEIQNNIISNATGFGIIALEVYNFNISNNTISEVATLEANQYGMYIDGNLILTLGAGPGIISNNTVIWATPSANSAGLYLGPDVDNTRFQVTNNNFGSTALGYVLNGNGAARKGTFFGNVTGNDPLISSFNCANVTHMVVYNSNLMANSVVLTSAANTPAGLEQAARGPYVLSIAPHDSFVFTNADGISFNGDESFNYWIVS